jgi:hypothetical protein
MSWLVDNANALYVLLGIVAAGMVVGFWFNRRVKFLAYAVGIFTLMGMLWLLTLFVPTDRKHLDSAVKVMAQAVEEGKVDDLFKYISNDFQYKGMTRKELYDKAQLAIRLHKVNEIRISDFRVEELSRTNKTAKTRFRVSAWAAGVEQPYLFITQADFVLEGNQWKLKTMRFYNPLVDQDKEIDLPGF